MYCPECGHDAGDAKYCPECGADLESLRNAVRGKTTGQRTGAKRQGGQGQGGQGGGGGGGQPEQPAQPAGGLSASLIWGIFGAVAVVVIVVVVMLSGGFGGKSGNAATTNTAPPSVKAVVGVTTGSYSDLVAKGNEFYDQGDAAFQSENFEQGSEYFKAAAMTYAAAWKKQQTDPNVGTDFATSLFYAGSLEEAVKQVGLVINKFPDFQPAYFNLGNYLAHEGRIAAQQGDQAASDKAYAEAKRAYTKAVSLDPSSKVGKQADASLKALPQ